MTEIQNSKPVYSHAQKSKQLKNLNVWVIEYWNLRFI